MVFRRRFWRRRPRIGSLLVLADRDPLSRAFVASLLAKADGHHVTHASDFAELTNALKPGHPFELAIVDFDLPGMGRDVGLQHLRKSVPAVKFVVLTNMTEEAAGSLSRGLACDQVLSKHVVPRKLARVVRSVLKAEEQADVSLGPVARPEPQSDKPNEPDLFGHQLTPRQQSILRLIVGGLTNRQIAKVLGITEGTVKVHINAAYKIMGVRNRVSAAAAFSSADRGDPPPEEARLI